jgi:hypothetical protein
MFTLDDTRGCSCEQILDRIGNAMGQRLFGCSVAPSRTGSARGTRRLVVCRRFWLSSFV